MNSGFQSNVPILWGSDTDNSYNQHNGYNPGQYFWNRYHDAQLQQFPQDTFVQMLILAQFQHPSHSELVQSSSNSLAAQSSPPAASPESTDVEDSSQASESPAKAGRGYGKWREEEEKLLVQLWCNKHT